MPAATMPAMRTSILGFVLACSLSASAAAQTSVQQDFESAQAHLSAGRMAEARAGFTALLTRLGPQSRSRSSMIVRSRLAETMVSQSEETEAEPLLQAALAAFPASTPAVAEERSGVLRLLAIIEEERGALRAATARWRQIIEEKLLPDGSVGMAEAGIGLARTAIWHDPAAARAQLLSLQAHDDAYFGAKDAVRRTRVVLWRLEAQLAMQEGRLADARMALGRASRLAGGTTSAQVDLGDVRLRGDLVVLAWLEKRPDEVNKLLAASGSTMLDDGARDRGGASNQRLPACAPVTGLAPDAMAVIEFSVRDDGRVINVRPVYAHPGSGPADSHPEEEFAAAVHGWSWPAAQASKIDAFWRSSVRVELRCMTRQPDVIAASFGREWAAWRDTHGLAAAPSNGGTDARRRVDLLAELQRREAAAGADAAALIPVLLALTENDAVAGKEGRAWATRLHNLAQQHDAPPSVRARALWMMNPDVTAGNVAALAALEASGQGTSRFADALRLEALSARDNSSKEAILRAVVARRDADDPIRTKALVMLSDLSFARGDVDASTGFLRASGLNPQQCALIDARPAGVNAWFSDSDFPQGSLVWNLSGYVEIGYDIAPDGRTGNVRIISARPPFAFDDASLRRVSAWRYKPVQRGDGSIGCVGRVQQVRFRGRQ
jgi:Gram-negative bacterial TonB protein C-terminal